MTFEYDYPDNWHVETTHDITLDSLCNDAIEPTIAFATDWGSTAFQHQFNDADGNSHVIVVRQNA